MADSSGAWSLWSAMIEAGSIAAGTLAAGIGAIVGIIWQRGHKTAEKAAETQQHEDALAGLSERIIKMESLEHRVTILEGQQNSIAKQFQDMIQMVSGLRSEMNAGFDSLRMRQDRMYEAMAKKGD